MWSFGLDFIVLTEGSVLRDLGVNSVIIMRVLGGGREWGPILTLAGGPIFECLLRAFILYCHIFTDFDFV